MLFDAFRHLAVASKACSINTSELTFIIEGFRSGKTVALHQVSDKFVLIIVNKQMSNIKMTRSLVGNFEKKFLRGTRPCFLGVG